jgi:putative membrane protein
MVLATLRAAGRERPRAVTAVLSVVGYALVIGVFAGAVPFPPLSDATVVLFGDLIAVVNTVALTALLAGAWFIKRGEVRKHRAAMLTAFALILVFLVLYLWKVGGGFEKSITASGAPRIAYLVMLAVHIFLSVVAVPVVLHAVVLGLTHTPAELRNSAHPTVGRIAVASWSLSLFLGIVTYLMLNHVYGWEVRHAALLALGRPALGRSGLRRAGRSLWRAHSVGRREGEGAEGEGADRQRGE